MRDSSPSGGGRKPSGIDPMGPVGWMGAGLNAVLRPFLALLGLLLLLLSIPIGFATPFLPIGLPIGICGVVLLGRNSVWGKRWMESVLVRYPKTERLAPNWLMKLVFGREKRRSKD